MISDKKIQTAFMLVCVETYRDMLPIFVKAVPTILTKDRCVLEGAAAYALVDLMNGLTDRSQSQPLSRSQRIPDINSDSTRSRDASQNMHHDSQLTDCSIQDLSGAWSDGYSFLDPNGTEIIANGVFSGILENTNISHPPESKDGKRRTTTESLQNKKLDSYISNRENETKLLRLAQGGVGGAGQRL